MIYTHRQITHTRTHTHTHTNTHTHTHTHNTHTHAHTHTHTQTHTHTHTRTQRARTHTYKNRTIMHARHKRAGNGGTRFFFLTNCTCQRMRVRGKYRNWAAQHSLKKETVRHT